MTWIPKRNVILEKLDGQLERSSSISKIPPELSVCTYLVLSSTFLRPRTPYLRDIKWGTPPLHIGLHLCCRLNLHRFHRWLHRLDYHQFCVDLSFFVWLDIYWIHVRVFSDILNRQYLVNLLKSLYKFKLLFGSVLGLLLFHTTQVFILDENGQCTSSLS